MFSRRHPDNQLEPTSPGTGAQAIEAGVFLFLIIPSMILSFFAVRTGSLGFMITALATIARDASLVCLVLFFLWKNGEPVERLGWSFHRMGKESILGFVLYPPFFLATAGVASGLQSIGLSGPPKNLPAFLSVSGSGEILLALGLVAVVALAEETVFRGYLLLRFQALISNRPLAVLLSAGVFMLGHGYEGAAGVLTVGLMGVVFAVVYLWRGSIVAPVVMHFLQDLTMIVILPILSAG